MDRSRVDYDQLAATYHSRYDGPKKLEGIAEALKGFRARKILEVGCGTGRFIEPLRETGASVFGLDASPGMLSEAVKRLGSDCLTLGHANHLPFASEAFDLVCCVNAIHHFDDSRGFIRDAALLLKPGGALAIVGIDPRVIRRRYYYEYFDGARDLDLRRYASFGQLVDWTAEAGLENVRLEVVERAAIAYMGRAIFDDPFLKKESNSLLALLSEEIYAEGLRRIQSAADRGAEFATDISFGMITGFRPPIAYAIETA